MPFCLKLKMEPVDPTVKTTRSPKLGASKPIYLLDIQLAAENVDAALEPRKRDVVTRVNDLAAGKIHLHHG